MLTRLLILTSCLALTSVAAAQDCPEGFVCVEQADMQQFLQLARDHKCRAEKEPTVTADPVSIIVDREGRVFGSGTGSRPFHLRVDWCNYHLEAESQIKLQTAMRVEPEWGFRFRPKAAFGILGRDLIEGHRMIDAGDVGLMIEPFFYHWANINGYVSFRSIGAGLGADITTNFGAAALLNVTWGSWRANPFLAVYFAF